jgi:hypothetical protein
LLDVWDNNFDLKHPERRVLNFNILRTRDQDEWREVVDSLMEICPVIVMDISENSEPVQYELKRLVDRKLMYKTVFVSLSSDRIPRAFESARVSGLDISDFTLVPKKNLRKLLRSVLTRRSRLPTPTVPVSERLRVLS